MQLHHRLIFFLLIGVSCSSLAAEPDIFAANKALGRGVNLGNALEAPKEGDWGIKLEESFFPQIKGAGFSHVRLPTKWSAHAGTDAPYTIEQAFFERVDWVLDQAEKHGLAVVLNVHHYDEMDSDPDAHLPRLVALWRQIAARYRDRPASLYFELLNEPHGKLNDEGKWNACIPPVLAAVRESNKTRPVIIGGAWWNGIWAVPKLKLPDDPNLIVTVHCYDPFEFTHQGASWAKGSDKWLGRTWTGSEAELKKLRDTFDIAAKYGHDHKRPIYLGEFGAYEKADLASRVAWTRAMTRAAEARGFSWAYWEFCAGFGVYDRSAAAFRPELLSALLAK
ncbi:MAG: glycoside hydrolase family 5 protein [Pirellulaceae bacterium]|nr:glycoside hydrolase family 5 protein [Pirellulaceae bacterium]